MLDFFLWVVFSLFWMAEVTSGLRVLPFETGFGAKIVDVNMEQISGRDFDLIHAALLAYKVLIVGSQINLTVDGQRQFTSRFGSLHVHLDNTSHYPGYNDINIVSNIKGIGGVPIGLSGPRVEKFHSDLSWASMPTKITVLKSMIRPEECGDTIFADTNAAYEGLDEELKAQIQDLQGTYCYVKNTTHSASDASQDNHNNGVLFSTCAVHPLVTTHPITGKHNLYANPSHTTSIVGLKPAASDALLQRLFEHVAKPEYTFRHKYHDGDVIIWDNRAVHHRATACPSEFPRLLARTTVNNDQVPMFNPHAVPVAFPTGAGSDDIRDVFDLAKDRVNAVPLQKSVNSTQEQEQSANSFQSRIIQVEEEIATASSDVVAGL